MNTKIKVIILSSLVLIFLIITFFVVNKNIFVINLDTTVKTFIDNHQSPSVYNTMLSITKTGDVFGAFIIFIVFGLFLILKNKKSFYIFAIASSTGIILTEIIKHLVQRVRPYNLLEQGSSFPSAHTTIVTVFLLSSIFLLIPFMKKGGLKTVFLLITLIVFPLVAFSRIYLSVHWTTDVIAGIILGSISFIFAKIVCCYKKENVL